ncbi:MAG: hypothetical protein GDA39_09440 [Hyphomonadaceae bacterium]|nr:hypothetical protein [Hyphomonadaceae bacterium]MBC6413062.1 hypothetical protein [Hyphomonadaceae bacterium]
MTFHIFDIDTGHVALRRADVTTMARRIRSRRRTLVLTSCARGIRISGFGF